MIPQQALALGAFLLIPQTALALEGFLLIPQTALALEGFLLVLYRSTFVGQVLPSPPICLDLARLVLFPKQRLRLGSSYLFSVLLPAPDYTSNAPRQVPPIHRPVRQRCPDFPSSPACLDLPRYALTCTDLPRIAQNAVWCLRAGIIHSKKKIK